MPDFSQIFRVFRLILPVALKACLLFYVGMEEKDKPDKHRNEEVTLACGIPNELSKEVNSHEFTWHETVTVIDLSGKDVLDLDDKMKLPTNLIHLNLSHNKLVKVPNIIITLEKLAFLNLSHNRIKYFDDCPKFCHTLELLDMSYNHLEGPPYWIWTEAPQNLSQLNLNNNSNITMSFVNGYFEELLHYNTLVTEVNISNCRLDKFTKLLGTFCKGKSLCLGGEDYISTKNRNSLLEIPCQGLDKCCDLKSLNVCNTRIYTITPSIEMYKNLIEINLAQNEFNGLPNEFCNLENLEICVLSGNKILYLPDEMYKMQKLSHLYLDSNELCMLPDTLCKLVNLKTLDLYNNNLDKMPNFESLEKLDLALNYFEEPDDIAYLGKKEKLRLMLHKNRYNGRKNLIIESDDDYRSGLQSEDDEELYEIYPNDKRIESPDVNPPSSPEDWDSDAHWVPCHQNPMPTIQSPWLFFVKQKMKEGNFCPMDAHPVSIVERLKHERLTNPQVFHETDGQFDDYSSDDT